MDIGIFEHDAAFDEGARTAARQAVAVAYKRVSDAFGTFLAGATDEDREARFALIEDDLRTIVAEVVDEYGGDVDTIESSLLPTLAAGAFCDDCRGWKSGPKASCTCDSDGDGDCDEDDADAEAETEETMDEKTARWAIIGGGYGLAQGLPDDLTQQQPGMPPAPGGQGGPPVPPTQPQMPGAPLGGPVPTTPNNSPQQAIPGPQDTHVPDPQLALQQAIAPQDPRNPAQFPTLPTLASEKTAEALTTEKLPKGDDTALGGPSPKMDKKRWTVLKPIKTEEAGSPHPTLQQDVSDVADHSADFLAQTDAVSESQDVGKEGDIDAIHTDTWSGTSGQADPVTASMMGGPTPGGVPLTPEQEEELRLQQERQQAGIHNVPPGMPPAPGHAGIHQVPDMTMMGAADADKNPLRALIEQGFVPETQAFEAIARFEAS